MKIGGKILLLMLALALCMGGAACGGGNDDDNGSKKEVQGPDGGGDDDATNDDDDAGGAEELPEIAGMTLVGAQAAALPVQDVYQPLKDFFTPVALTVTTYQVDSLINGVTTGEPQPMTLEDEKAGPLDDDDDSTADDDDAGPGLRDQKNELCPLVQEIKGERTMRIADFNAKACKGMNVRGTMLVEAISGGAKLTAIHSADELGDWYEPLPLEETQWAFTCPEDAEEQEIDCECPTIDYALGMKPGCYDEGDPRNDSAAMVFGDYHFYGTVELTGSHIVFGPDRSFSVKMVNSDPESKETPKLKMQYVGPTDVIPYTDDEGNEKYKPVAYIENGALAFTGTLDLTDLTVKDYFRSFDFTITADLNADVEGSATSVQNKADENVPTGFPDQLPDEIVDYCQEFVVGDSMLEQIKRDFGIEIDLNRDKKEWLPTCVLPGDRYKVGADLGGSKLNVEFSHQLTEEEYGQLIEDIKNSEEEQENGEEGEEEEEYAPCFCPNKYGDVQFSMSDLHLTAENPVLEMDTGGPEPEPVQFYGLLGVTSSVSVGLRFAEDAACVDATPYKGAYVYNVTEVDGQPTESLASALVKAEEVYCSSDWTLKVLCKQYDQEAPQPKELTETDIYILRTLAAVRQSAWVKWVGNGCDDSPDELDCFFQISIDENYLINAANMAMICANPCNVDISQYNCENMWSLLFGYCSMGCPEETVCNPIADMCVECLSDDQCAVEGEEHCDIIDGVCMECTEDEHCDAGVCKDGECKGECAEDKDCEEGYCFMNDCVECKEARHCENNPDGFNCVSNECACLSDRDCDKDNGYWCDIYLQKCNPPCTDSDQCPWHRPVCLDSECVQCLPGEDVTACQSGEVQAICIDNSCVPCFENVTCKTYDENTPICEDGLCRPCKENSECGLRKQCVEGRCE